MTPAKHVLGFRDEERPEYRVVMLTQLGDTLLELPEGLLLRPRPPRYSLQQSCGFTCLVIDRGSVGGAHYSMLVHSVIQV